MSDLRVEFRNKKEKELIKEMLHKIVLKLKDIHFYTERTPMNAQNNKGKKMH